MPKMNNVTNTDIELLIDSGNDIAARALDFNDRIFKGQLDLLDGPLQKSLELLATSRALADLAMRIMNKATLKEMYDTTEAQMRERHAER